LGQGFHLFVGKSISARPRLRRPRGRDSGGRISRGGAPLHSEGRAPRWDSARKTARWGTSPPPRVAVRARAGIDLGLDPLFRAAGAFRSSLSYGRDPREGSWVSTDPAIAQLSRILRLAGLSLLQSVSETVARELANRLGNSSLQVNAQLKRNPRDRLPNRGLSSEYFVGLTSHRSRLARAGPVTDSSAGAGIRVVGSRGFNGSSAPLHRRLRTTRRRAGREPQPAWQRYRPHAGRASC
jgi:hypothetical protein